MTKSKEIKLYLIMFGCDPEFFFTKGGLVVGAEKVLPKDGIVAENNTSTKSRIIIDGVQAELNPAPATCRQLLAKEISRCFVSVRDTIDKDFKLDFSQTVEVPKENFDDLSDGSKKFGCMPSKNAYKTAKASKITVDPTVYRSRSAGGHIHLGRYQGTTSLDKRPKRTVAMMDLIVGNTSVLIDRDEGNIERRKNYGRAGEYRTPKHGIEYRTLSNFWLKDYALMSFVMGLSRLAVSIVEEGLDKKFLKLVDMEDVEKAINNNDFDLAYENFLKIEPLISEITPKTFHENHALSAYNIPHFKYFVEKGLAHWFKTDPYKHWLEMNLNYYNKKGWESFLQDVVRVEMEKNNK